MTFTASTARLARPVDMSTPIASDRLTSPPVLLVQVSKLPMAQRSRANSRETTCQCPRPVPGYQLNHGPRRLADLNRSLWFGVVLGQGGLGRDQTRRDVHCDAYPRTCDTSVQLLHTTIGLNIPEAWVLALERFGATLRRFSSHFPRGRSTWVPHVTRHIFKCCPHCAVQHRI
jgi:hypothetical protein